VLDPEIAVPDSRRHWLETTIDAVRDVMAKRLQQGSLAAEDQRELEMALEELDVMWEELQGQATLLARESARYAEFFEHAPEAYLITDAGGSVREANQAARELLGADPCGRQLAGFVPEAERAHFLAMFLGAVDGSRARAWEGVLGTTRVQFSVRAIPLRKSAVSGLCWLLRLL
jgi:PAS domain S-box-containing protein